MYKFLLIFTFLLFIPLESGAQKLELGGTVVAEPICFILRNTANHDINGNFGTNYYLHPEYKTEARHRSNFRLGAAGSVDAEGYPNDMAEFCSYGPFFDDMKLELVLRTLFPVFTCYTKIDQGEIVLHSERRDDGTGVNMWADCYE